MSRKLTDIRVDDIVAHLKRQPKILIVDDEEDVREMLELAFSTVGYGVARESCTNSASRRILHNGEKYDAIVSDFNNKGASGDYQGGLTLYERLQREAALPPLYVVISGQEGLPLPKEVPFMRKPIGLYDLAHQVTANLRQRLSTYEAGIVPEAK